MTAPKFSIRRVGGSILVRATGVIRLGDCNEIREELKAELSDRVAVNALLDVRGALVILSDEDLKAEAKSAQRAGVMLPIGILTDPSAERLAMRYCMEMQKVGRTRLWFSDPEDAARWLGVPPQALPPTRSFLPVSRVAS